MKKYLNIIVPDGNHLHIDLTELTTVEMNVDWSKIQLLHLVVGTPSNIVLFQENRSESLMLSQSKS